MTVLKLFASEDQALLVRWNALLVLEFCLDVVDRIRGLNLKGDHLSRECLDEDLHTATETEEKVEGRLLLDVVVQKGMSIFKLFSREDEALLVQGNAVWVNPPLLCCCRVSGLEKNFKVL